MSYIYDIGITAHHSCSFVVYIFFWLVDPFPLRVTQSALNIRVRRDVGYQGDTLLVAEAKKFVRLQQLALRATGGVRGAAARASHDRRFCDNDGKYRDVVSRSGAKRTSG